MSSKGMQDAIRAQVAGLTEGQRIFLANHMFKHYGVFPTKLRHVVPEDLIPKTKPKFNIGDVVEITFDGDGVDGPNINQFGCGAKGQIVEVDLNDEWLTYRVSVGQDGEVVEEWAPEHQLKKL